MGYPAPKRQARRTYSGTVNVTRPHVLGPQEPELQQADQMASPSPAVVHLSVTGCILPWSPAVPSERGQRAHGAPEHRAGAGYFGDTVRLLLLLQVPRARRVTDTLKAYSSCFGAGSTIQARLVSGPAPMCQVGQGHITAQGRMAVQGSRIIST